MTVQVSLQVPTFTNVSHYTDIEVGVFLAQHIKPPLLRKFTFLDVRGVLICELIDPSLKKRLERGGALFGHCLFTAGAGLGRGNSS